MVMQMKLGEFRYNPADEISYLGPALFDDTLRLLSEQPDRLMKKWVVEHGVTDEELAEVARTAAAVLLASQNLDEPDRENTRVTRFADACRDKGMDNVRDEAVTVFFYYFGVKTLAATYAASVYKAQSPEHAFEFLEPLRRSVEEETYLLSVPRWRRWLVRWSLRLGRKVRPDDKKPNPVRSCSRR